MIPRALRRCATACRDSENGFEPSEALLAGKRLRRDNLQAVLPAGPCRRGRESFSAERVCTVKERVRKKTSDPLLPRIPTVAPSRPGFYNASFTAFLSGRFRVSGGLYLTQLERRVFGGMTRVSNGTCQPGCPRVFCLRPVKRSRAGHHRAPRAAWSGEQPDTTMLRMVPEPGRGCANGNTGPR